MVGNPAEGAQQPFVAQFNEDAIQTYAAHFATFDTHAVLHGEIDSASLDAFSLLLNLIPPTFIHMVVAANDDLGPNQKQPEEKCVQIHLVGNNHYVVSCQENGKITVYDSIDNRDLRLKQLSTALKKIYKVTEHWTDNEVFSNINYYVPQSQGFTNDCGAFAAAHATSLIHNIDPLGIRLNQGQLRKHLLKCLQTKNVTIFPHSQKITIPQKKASTDIGNVDKSIKQTKKCTSNSKQNYHRYLQTNLTEKLHTPAMDMDEFCLLNNMIPVSVLQDDSITFTQKSKHEQSVQIHLVEKQFLVSCQVKGEVVVYSNKSITTMTMRQLIKQIRNIYRQFKDFNKSAIEKYIRIVIDKNIKDSLLFSASYAKTLIEGKDPSITEYIGSELQKHFTTCLATKKIIEFPQRYTSEQTTNKKVTDKTVDDNTLEEKDNSSNTLFQNYMDDQEQRQKSLHRRIKTITKRKEQKLHAMRLKRQMQHYNQREKIQQNMYKNKQRNNSEFRKKENESKHKPKVREQAKLFKRELRENPIIKQREATRKHRPKVREQAKQHKKELRKNLEYRKINALRKHTKQVRDRSRLSKTHTRKRKQNELANIDNVISRFKENCKQIPNCVCCICSRIMFKFQTVAFKWNNYADKDIILESVGMPNTKVARANFKQDVDEHTNICKSCHRYLKSKKVPIQAIGNNLKLLELVHPLNNLNQIEKHLISPVIPFMKILALPKGLQKGLHGPVVCVPSDIPQVTTTLPRPINDNTLIKIKLKRKMEYKGHHLFQHVSVANVLGAINYLKEHNPNFSNININVNAILNNNEEDEASIIINDTDNINVNSLPAVQEDLEDSPNDNEEVDHPMPQDVSTVTEAEDANSNEVDDIRETSCPMVSCLQAEDLRDVDPNNVFSIAPAEGNKPCSVFDIETQAFPCYFPDGKNGFTEARGHKIGLNRYLNARLFSSDTRFASDPEYIFFSQYLSEIKQLNGSISIAMRKGSKQTSDGKTITSSMLKNKDGRESLLKTDQGFQHMKSIRGSPAYWEKALKDLLAMLKQLGTPSWFCSFSAADSRWTEIRDGILSQQNKEPVQEMDWATYCRLINSNPVTACRMFENRVEKFIKEVILSPANPIGEVVDYFIRTEFQARGWPHIHCLFWLKDPVLFDEHGNNEEFIKFIAQYVSTCIPDKNVEEALHEIVTTVQCHSKKHSFSCKKGGKECRFGYPKPPSNKTFIAQRTNEVEGISEKAFAEWAQTILKKIWDVVNGDSAENILTANDIFAKANVTQEDFEKASNALTKRATVFYKRSPCDCWVNPYNKHLLLAWNGNMDIQPVLDPYSCIMYIVSYISKAERELGDLLRRTQKEYVEGNIQGIQQLKKLGNVYINHREVCVMEAIYRVTAMPLRRCSREVLFVPSDPHATRLSKPINQLEGTENEEIWIKNITDRYLARPIQAENLCLADFASKYKLQTRKKSAQNPTESNSDTECESEEANEVLTLRNNMGIMIKRKKMAVIRYPHFNKEKDSERYYANVLKMYMPHRTQDVRNEKYETYEDMFTKHKELVETNLQSYEKLATLVDNAWEEVMREPGVEDSWTSIAPNTESERLDQEREQEELRNDEMYEEINEEDIPDLTTHPQHEYQAGVHVHVDETSKTNKQNEHRATVRKLNKKQIEIFYFIREWALKKKHREQVEPFHIFLTGGAGTGKSLTIRCIYEEVTRILQPLAEIADSNVCLLLAPTGTAAFQINGQTIHHAMAINKASSKNLADSDLGSLRNKLMDVQLIIIDEISMVSSHLLELVHLRLQQAKNVKSTSSYFGNVCILAVGDFYQVPPIKGKELCLVNNVLTDLWSLFHIWELEEIMRQQGDAQFIKLLNRLRIRKKGENISDIDVKMLQDRNVTQACANYPHTSMHVFSTNKLCLEHNQEMLKKITTLNAPIFHLEAADTIHDSQNHKTLKCKTPLDVQIPPRYLDLCVGARVMLLMNIDVSDGLTNGAIGQVAAIINGNKPYGLPEAIAVMFDHKSVGQNARRIQSSAYNIHNKDSTILKHANEIIQRKPEKVTRHQYPLALAWAITIHKVQGMTVQKIVISLKKLFKPGMGYVALSRATSLNGLFLIKDDFELTNVYCNSNIAPALELMPKATIYPSWNATLHGNDWHRSFVIMSHNCEGFLPHLDDIRQNKMLQLADIVALQETWLSQRDVSSPLINHTIMIRNRENVYVANLNLPEAMRTSTKGGLALLIHNDIEYTPVDMHDIQIECMGIEMLNLNLTILNMYRPPNLPIQYFVAQVALLLQKVKTQRIIILGDFNVDLLKNKDKYLDNTLKDFKQILTNPTTDGMTLIDHIYTKNTTTKQVGVLQTYYSYHNVTFVTMDY